MIMLDITKTANLSHIITVDEAMKIHVLLTLDLFKASFSTRLIQSYNFLNKWKLFFQRKYFHFSFIIYILQRNIF